MLSYQWQGIEQATQRLHTLASLAGLDSELEAEGDAIVTDAQVYPAERPGQRYRRSEALKRAWKRGDARRADHSILVDITNDTPYGPYVMGDEQAEVHQGRWKPLRVIGKEHIGPLRTRAQAWALRLWRS